MALFTDGSSYNRDRSGGWAWLAFDTFGNEEIGMGGASDTTNNRMEMQAWIEGLTFLYRAHGAIDVLVYSDSEYVGLGITDRKRKRNSNVDLWLALDEAFDRHSYVEFIHVKGHQVDGSYYNDLVDQMAGEARQAFKHDATAALDAAEEAIERVGAAAPIEWKSEALEVVRLIASTNSEFTTDDIWPYLSEPPEPRAMGWVMAQAARDGWIRKTDRTVQSHREECHARPIRVWKSNL